MGSVAGLVGRRAELTALRSAVDKGARGTGAAVVVLGEAGIGKSRLLEAAVDRARAAGMAVLTGRAVAGGGAYRAVAAALAGHLRGRSPADGGLRPFLPALRRLLPAWTPDGDGQDHGVDEADPTVVLGEGVLRLLRPLGAERGSLLALEDLHWADADTVALVEYLADAAASTGLLLVVSARDDGPRGKALGRLAGALVLRPQRLTAAETAALAAAHAADLPTDRLELVVAAADGLPLLVEELVRQGRPGVPPTFAALVEQRLADLDDDAAVVLRAAAVLGVDPPWTLLPQVADRPEPVVSAALRAAWTRACSSRPAASCAGGTRSPATRWRPPRCPPSGRRRPPGGRGAARPRLGRRRRGGGAAGRRGRGRAGGDAPVPSGPPGPRARGAARAAEALLDRVPAARAADAAAERVVLLTRLGRVADALDAGERALPATTGDAHAELCLRLARAAVHAGQWQRAQSYVDRAGRPDDPRTSLLAADAAFGAGDVAGAAALAAEAVAATPSGSQAPSGSPKPRRSLPRRLPPSGPPPRGRPGATGRPERSRKPSDERRRPSRCARRWSWWPGAPSRTATWRRRPRRSAGRIDSRRARAPQATGGG